MGDERSQTGQTGLPIRERDPGVSLILNSEDSAPFDLEPVLIPLKIAKEKFKSSVGGSAS